jgi:hypothetical protein
MFLRNSENCLCSMIIPISSIPVQNELYSLSHCTLSVLSLKLLLINKTGEGYYIEEPIFFKCVICDFAFLIVLGAHLFHTHTHICCQKANHTPDLKVAWAFLWKLIKLKKFQIKFGSLNICYKLVHVSVFFTLSRMAGKWSKRVFYALDRYTALQSLE